MVIQKHNNLSIHLESQAPKTNRKWHIGFLYKPKNTPDSFVLETCPGDHNNFASFLSILQQIKKFQIDSIDLKIITELENEIASKNPNKDTKNKSSNFLANAVTYAIMRRISRESVFTSEIIDAGAKLLNKVFQENKNIKQVIVNKAETIDRLSLKILCRSILLLPSESSFTWHWYFTNNPLDNNNENTTDIFIYSRYLFFKKLLLICAPEIVKNDTLTKHIEKSINEENKTLIDISHALVLQNYDASILWSQSLINNENHEIKAETYRLLGITTINIGLIDLSLKFLNKAESITNDQCQKAHISYLQGLVIAKRKYDLFQSDLHYMRGVQYLVNSKDSDIERTNLEKAWLNNGLAMNETLRAKNEASETEKQLKFEKAFFLVHDAFKLIESSTSSASIYLRFNLIANSAFLMEIQREYALAISTFTRTFKISESQDTWHGRSWKSTLGYRLASLYLKSGQNEKALDILMDIEKETAVRKNTAIYERILRCLSYTLLKMNRHSEAQRFYNIGLNICLQDRSAIGAIEHFKGLCITYYNLNDYQNITSLIKALEKEDFINSIVDTESNNYDWLAQLSVSIPSSKLPAYIPEIDLEDTPEIDLNKYLSSISTNKLSTIV